MPSGFLHENEIQKNKNNDAQDDDVKNAVWAFISFTIIPQQQRQQRQRRHTHENSQETVIYGAFRSFFIPLCVCSSSSLSSSLPLTITLHLMRADSLRVS